MVHIDVAAISSVYTKYHTPPAAALVLIFSSSDAYIHVHKYQRGEGEIQGNITFHSRNHNIGT